MTAPKGQTWGGLAHESECAKTEVRSHPTPSELLRKPFVLAALGSSGTWLMHRYVKRIHIAVKILQS